MRSYNVAVIPGDGIGPEVVEQGLKALSALRDTGLLDMSWEILPWGSEYWLKHGRMMPADALEVLEGFDAIYVGATGDPRVPDPVTSGLILDIRFGFDQYVNLRPIRLLPGVESPLKGKSIQDIDFVVVRENTEGEYMGIGGRFKKGTPDEAAIQVSVFTRKGTERVIRYAFDIARNRKRFSSKKPSVTNCSKSNVLNYSMTFWDTVFGEVAVEYPEISTRRAFIDAITMWLVKNPESFDVIVASNLFGDIITDLGAALQGGMGFAPGANIRPDRAKPSMFEPIHGSAPKYKGMNVANPIAAVWAAQMMLEFLGADLAAGVLMKAIETVTAEGKVRTRDMGGTATTSQMGDAIVEAVRRGAA